MPPINLSLQSRHRTCRGIEAGSWRDVVHDHDSTGVYAVISADGQPVEAELAARAVREILRRSLDGGGLSFADRMLVAEEALESILGVLQDDADRKGVPAADVSFAVGLVGGGWLGILGSGPASLHVLRAGALYRLAGGAMSTAGGQIERKITALAPGDRLFLASAGLASACDESLLAAEMGIDDLQVADRLAEKFEGHDDVSAIAIVVGEG